MKAVALAAVAALTLGGTAARATEYTYSGTLTAGGVFASYSITTARDDGILAGSGVVDFTFDLTSPAGKVQLNPSNTSYNGVFSATPLTLSQNGFIPDSFTGPDVETGSQSYPNEVVFSSTETSVRESTASGQYGGDVPNPTGVVATLSAVSAAPEPSTWLLMFAGIGGIGVMMRQAKRKMGFRFKVALAA